MRYMPQERSSWAPAQYVVVDRMTGGIVSRHRSEAEAKDAARGMNAPRPNTRRG